MEKVFKKLTLAFLFVFALGLSGAAVANAATEAATHAQELVSGHGSAAAGEIPNHQRILEADPYGVGLAITSMSVVFTSLLTLYVVFRLVGIVMIWAEKRRKKRALEHAAHEVHHDSEAVFSGEIAAAISFAIQMYENDLHDKESTVLTINRVAKAYSPWNSKIHGLTQLPDIKK